ncbi:MAG: 2'-deoxycytidine 5'-triphosphate deaminase [Succinimonas sp.]|nr:2'-deoxycytidine 5'-triphosphate deaminase [Succinimonas sp.]
MSILSDNQIISAVNDNFIGIEPLAKNRIQPASIDLTLYDKIEIVTADFVDFESLQDEESESLYITQEIGQDGYILAPGSYVIGYSAEMLSFTTGFNARICNKNSLVRWGLDAATGNFINPGFKGRMPLIIRNFGTSKLKLRAGMKICQLEIHQLDNASTRNYENRHDPEALVSDIPDWEKRLQEENKNLDHTFSDFLHQRILANSR